MKKTQNDMVLEYMREYGSITQLDAMLELGVMRLASRICDLKKKGYKIVSLTQKVPNRHGGLSSIAVYVLDESAKCEN